MNDYLCIENGSQFIVKAENYAQAKEYAIGYGGEVIAEGDRQVFRLHSINTDERGQDKYNYKSRHCQITFGMHPTEPFETIVYDTDMCDEYVADFVDAWFSKAIGVGSGYYERIQKIECSLFAVQPS